MIARKKQPVHVGSGLKFLEMCHLAGKMGLRALPYRTFSFRWAFRPMQADRWDAGSALMQAASPQGWQDLVAASALVRANQEALNACQQAATNNGKDQRCVVTLKTETGRN